MCCLIVTLATVGIFLADLYTPSLPAISTFFAVSPSVVKLSVSLYLFGVVSLQLFFGPLSDVLGRKRVILSGLLFALLGSVICMLSSSILMLNVGRFIQGMGIAAVSPITRAVSRDVFSNDQLVKVFGFIGVAIGVAPALAPLLGGYVQHAYDWRSVFVLMAGVVLVVAMVVVLFLPETNRNVKQRTFRISVTLKSYYRLLTMPSFMLNLSYSACALSIIMVYFTLSPYLLQNALHLSVLEYSWSSACIVLMMLIGRSLTVFLSRYYRLQNIAFFGVFVMFLGATMMVFVSELGLFTVWALLIPVAVIMFGIGLVLGNVMVLAFEHVRDMAGAAGALFGTGQLFFAALLSAVAAHLPSHDSISLSWMCFVIALLAGTLCLIHGRFVLKST